MEIDEWNYTTLLHTSYVCTELTEAAAAACFRSSALFYFALITRSESYLLTLEHERLGK